MQTMNNPAPPVVGLENMETDKALDVMMEILPDVAIILNDPEADAILKKVRGEEAKALEAGDAFAVLVPLFAKKYKPQLLRIVATCQGVALDEVKQQPVSRTIGMLANALRVMTGFFGCCLHMARNM